MAAPWHIAAALAVALLVGLLHGVAWASARGSVPFAWQPVVGFTVSSTVRPLIVGSYFGSDAAVSVVTMFRTSGGDAEEIARLDRDLAVPRQGWADGQEG